MLTACHRPYGIAITGWLTSVSLAVAVFAAVFPSAVVAQVAGGQKARAEDASAENGDSEKAANELLDRALEAIEGGRSEAAEKLLSQAIEANGKLADAYYFRGRERFRLGRFKESLADFDRYVALRPDLESRQWERGIAAYYAGEFKKGAEQFKLYQTFHDSDVENSAWRFLCQARVDGMEKARQQLLEIKNDPRVPMMAIYEMFRGNKTPDDVLAAARAGDPPAERLAGRMFYAELYIGLYYEAIDEPEKARPHLLSAADDHETTAGINQYMWDVARVHADRIRKPSGENKPQGEAAK